MIASKNRGFVALISVIVVSTILLLTLLDAGNSFYSNRLHLLRDENREENLAAANSCLEITILELSRNHYFRLTDQEKLINLDQSKCKIQSVVGSTNGPIIIKTLGFSGSTTSGLETTLHFINDFPNIDFKREILYNFI